MRAHQEIPPWDLKGLEKITFNTLTRTTKKDSKEKRKEEALENLARLGSLDLELWTDGTVLQGEGAGAALMFTGQDYSPRPQPEPPPDDTDTGRPSKRRKINLHQGIEFEIEGMSRVPAGRASSSAEAELVALNAGVDMLLNRVEKETGLKILIASDSLSNLIALEAGPLRQKDEKRKELWKKLILLAQKSESVVLQFINSHVGIPKNELVDMVATESLRLVKLRQDEVSTSLGGIKNKVRECLRNKWLKKIPLDRHRRLICGLKRSDLTDRDTWNREEQCLVARMRCGELPEMGPFVRRVNPELSRTCRWCEGPDETVAHCLGECTGLRDLRSRHDVSLESLAKARRKEEVARIRQFVIDAVGQIQGGRGIGTRVRKNMCTPQMVSSGKRAKVVLDPTNSDL
jgi:ribonuclease HI